MPFSQKRQVVNKLINNFFTSSKTLVQNIFHITNYRKARLIAFLCLSFSRSNFTPYSCSSFSQSNCLPHVIINLSLQYDNYEYTEHRNYSLQRIKRVFWGIFFVSANASGFLMIKKKANSNFSLLF